MKLQLRHNRWFFKHLFSYILLLVVPLIIINGFFGKRINETYQQTVVSRLESDILTLRNTLDNEIELLFSTVNQIQLLRTVNLYDFEDNPLQANAIKTLLRTFTVTNRLIEEIVYYPYDQNYLFTSSTTSKVDFFFKEVYVSKVLDAEAFLHDLSTVKYPKAYPVKLYNKEEGLVLAFPLLTDYATSDGVCLFYVSNSILDAMIKTQLVQYDASLVIHDEDGELLFATNKRKENSKENSLSFSISSNLVSWIFSVQVPREQSLLQDLNRLSQMQQTSNMIVIVAVLILIFFLMLINYTPIKRLQKQAIGLFEGANRKQMGELEDIARSLEFLKNQNSNLAEKWEKSRESEQNIALQRLLSGYYKTIDQFHAQVLELSICLVHPFFLVSCIHIQEINLEIDQLALLMRKNLPESLNCYYIFTPMPDRIYFINSVSEEGLKNLPEIYETMRKTIEKQTGLSLTVGLGSAYSESSAIPQSFLEARTALDYRFLKGKNTTIVFAEVSKSMSYSVTYPHALLDKLHISLNAYDNQAIEAHAESLIQFLLQENIPLFLAKSISLDMMTLFFDHLPPTLQTQEESQRDFFLLSDIDTIQEVVEVVQSVKMRLGNMEKPKHSEAAKSLMMDITTYIKDHCFECNFSMLQVADHFSMQLPTLSVMFKEFTQVNLLDYVTALRMDFAKRLLEETELPLKDISLQIGYYNLSSFIRRFKQLNGITPGDYRKLHHSIYT